MQQKEEKKAYVCCYSLQQHLYQCYLATFSTITCLSNRLNDELEKKRMKFVFSYH